MKVKLYKGPFNGKSMSHPHTGRNDIIIRGPKPMTRKQKYEWDVNNRGLPYAYPPLPYPTVEARYKICVRVVESLNSPGVFFNAPLTHPDGSIFYEYVEGSKREY